MVFRVFVEKKEGLREEALSLKNEIVNLLGISSLNDLRIINRYDCEDISEELFKKAIPTVFSEPQVDDVYEELDHFENCFAVEYLPGQFDQRADSAAQCIQLISQGNRPVVRSAKVYVLFGDLNEDEIAQIKKYVINPVEARLASMDKPASLTISYEIPDSVKIEDGFRCLKKEELEVYIQDNGLAMDIDDILFCQDYFKKIGRDPTITEIKMIDTYWSDHCRHTTFSTIIDDVHFEDELVEETYKDYLKTRADLDRKKPVCLMDLGTIMVKVLSQAGKLDKLDASEEINACTVKIEIEVDGKKEPWLLLFKNETHNHPTEIEPFGGAATCIGGAIRDPLSGRSYVYAAMRITGAGDPLVDVKDTIEGKLPQRKIVTTAAKGYSSYGNQIGLATGIVEELYHPGYVAKRMEIGAVIGATPAGNVRRERPVPGDIVILLGGATGRDGIGGATGASKAHNVHSVEDCGAEVQKGNAPEERKLQRLFRNKEASLMIKRCNDFGAGGVSVAIGELADGLAIDLNAVPKKYEGLDGTELAISESQERMAVVVSKDDVDRFLKLAEMENLMATVVAQVTEEPVLSMTWNGKKIVEIDREFLDSNGADKHIKVQVEKGEIYHSLIEGNFVDEFKKMAADLNFCSHRGLGERFDSTINAGTVLMPYGGRYQLTPIQAMVHKINVEKGHTDDVSLMSWAYDPYVSSSSPFRGAYLAVLSSVCKLIATGAPYRDIYLTFQEYFERLGSDPKRWGKPFAALLGAYKAQKELQIAAIGGKDSMSGSFEDLDVPPTLVSFAVTTAKIDQIISPEMKKAGNKLVFLQADLDKNGLPITDSLMDVLNKAQELIASKKSVSAYHPGRGGIGEAVMKMAMGNGFGFSFADDLSVNDIFGGEQFGILLEVEDGDLGEYIGEITEEPVFVYQKESVSLKEISDLYENKLEDVYRCNIPDMKEDVETVSKEYEPFSKTVVLGKKPQVLIPVFPGNNCEYDSAKAIEDAGGIAKIMVIRNLNSDAIKESVKEVEKELKNSQMIFIPGGFSGGDEPDGSGKFITAFFRNQAIKEGVEDLLDNRGGLICGVCNGFQALIKLGLVPYGKIIDMDENCPTLTFNTIGRHQSRIVSTRIASNKSPWLSLMKVGDIVNVPISHGEGRFLASDELIKQLIQNGQIATQYVDLSGEASKDVHFNPNGSFYAIEGITSPDGRVFGKMGHAERTGKGLFKNVPGNYDIRMFESAVKYFK